MENIVYKSRRGIALLLIMALLLWIAPTPAKALTGLDDVAIIAALLASLGISAITYGATQTMLDGLAERLDAYGATQGMESGEFASSIVGQTSIRAPRILQLAKSGWQALMGFINYIKTEQGGGLSVQNPITHGNDFVVIDNYRYPVIHAIDWENYNASSFALNKTVSETGAFGQIGDGSTFQWGDKLVETSWSNYSDRIKRFNFEGVGWGLSSFQAGGEPQCYYAFEPHDGYLYLLVSFYTWDARWKGLRPWSTFPGDNMLSTDPRRLDMTDAVMELQTDWQINDDNFDLSYLTDSVSDIYIRLGSIEGDVDTLAGIAQAVVDAYDSSYAETGAGTITATATTADIGAAGDYAVDLTSFFPFCIPYDIYHMIEALDAEPLAPHIEIPLDFSLDGGEETLVEQDTRNKIVVDFSEWEDTAKVLRAMELVLFAVGLALLTRKVIKW